MPFYGFEDTGFYNDTKNSKPFKTTRFRQITSDTDLAPLLVGLFVDAEPLQFFVFALQFHLELLDPQSQSGELLSQLYGRFRSTCGKTIPINSGPE